MVTLRTLKILLITLGSMFLMGANCATPGNIKVYTIHPIHGLFRHADDGKPEWIPWNDPRLQCREIPASAIDDDSQPEYECPYGAMSFDDIGTIIDMNNE